MKGAKTQNKIVEKEYYKGTSIKERTKEIYHIMDTFPFERYFHYVGKHIQQGNILDLGCGVGHFCFFLEKKLTSSEIWGVDISEFEITAASNYKEQNSMKSHFSVGDGENLEFENEFFDTVILLSTLHHFPERRQVLSEVYRVLKSKKGRCIIIEPNIINPLVMSIAFKTKLLGKYWGTPNEFPFSIFRLREEVLECGFQIIELKGIMFFPWKLLRRSGNIMRLDSFIGNIPLINSFGVRMAGCFSKTDARGE